MNKKKLIHFIILLAAVAVISYFLFHSNKKDVTRHVSKRTDSSSLGNYNGHMKNDHLKQNIVETDYYMLALSWSPAFCQKKKKDNNGKVSQNLKYQCDSSQKFGWVIHGLWPQNGKAKRIDEHPRYCQGDLPVVEKSTIEAYLNESPGANLLQGQWEKHGACAFNQPTEYFAKQKELYNDLILPNFTMSTSDLFKWMRANNPRLNGVYLRGGKGELYICYDKKWQPMDCPR